METEAGTSFHFASDANAVTVIFSNEAVSLKTTALSVICAYKLYEQLINKKAKTRHLILVTLKNPDTLPFPRNLHQDRISM